jgi:hypothetical protein
VRIPAERQEERRAEESRKNHSLDRIGKAGRWPKRGGVATAAATKAVQGPEAGGYRQRVTVRPASLSICEQRYQKGFNERHTASYIGSGTASFCRGSLRRERNPRASTAGCGKPHVRWCGRTNGATPLARPDRLHRQSFAHRQTRSDKGGHCPPMRTGTMGLWVRCGWGGGLVDDALMGGCSG